jgi:hypothetical protein
VKIIPTLSDVNNENDCLKGSVIIIFIVTDRKACSDEHRISKSKIDSGVEMTRTIGQEIQHVDHSDFFNVWALFRNLSYSKETRI